MQSILSIQSHVCYGYVGNKAAVYPLQSMGYDVCPVNTVQFSNHTGYGKWQGQIFEAEHIIKIVQGVADIGKIGKFTAVLSGYMGSKAICDAVQQIVKEMKAANPNIIYLCDPVIGNNHCYVKPEVLGFFQTELMADIITPNQYEAEVLSKIQIKCLENLIDVASFFHGRGIKIVVITGISINDGLLYNFVSDQNARYLIKANLHKFDVQINGTGDLFSAVFLGTYLQTLDIRDALRNAVYYLDQALKNTYEMKESELQVLSLRYDVYGGIHSALELIML